MSAEDDILREIAEHPCDSTCRLIYADWLQEHGDAPPRVSLFAAALEGFIWRAVAGLLKQDY